MPTQEQAKRTIELLEQAKRVITEVPDERFDMGDWTSLGECGTKHCFGGWLRLDTWFMENTFVSGVFHASDENGFTWVFPEWEEWPNGSGTLGEALALLMGVEVGEAGVLFGLSFNDEIGWCEYLEDEGSEGKENIIIYINELIRRRTPYALGILPD